MCSLTYSGKAVSTMPALKIGGIILALPPPQNVPNSNSNAGRPGAFLAPFLKYCKGRTHKKEDKNGIGFLVRLGAQPDLLETRLAKFSFCEVLPHSLSNFQPKQETYFAKMVRPASYNFRTVAMSPKLYAAKSDANIRAGGTWVALCTLKIHFFPLQPI